ncbi:MAG: hypothetical protein EOP04_32610 [Proteobacteria bacterium]|nr:MAG: hypothetical protein EOP04_32610 [Pseudomonadota bacterium]
MKTHGIHKLLVFGSLALLLSACSMEASIQSLVDEIAILKAPGQAHGITSGSAQSVTTQSGLYKVSASVGVTGSSTLTNNPSIVHTTSSGLKVFSSLQGAIVAE